MQHYNINVPMQIYIIVFRYSCTFVRVFHAIQLWSISKLLPTLKFGFDVCCVQSYYCIKYELKHALLESSSLVLIEGI